MDRYVYFSNLTTYTVENGVCHIAIDPDLGLGVVVHLIGDLCVGYRIVY